MEINIQELGAISDGVTLCTAMIQSAIDRAHAAGGGRVVIPSGRYMTGTLILKSNVELHLGLGAVLLGSPECADYPERTDLSHVNSPMLPRRRNACMIYADESQNIAITGLGIIDCNGEHFVRLREGENINNWKYERIDAPTPPRVIFFTGCRNAIIKDITVTNQPAGWCCWIHDCDYVSVDRMKIESEVDYPNNDGIHINCSRNVTVSNCSITCGDDCLVIRANSVSLAENKVCERVVVTNCNLTSYSGGVRIGWVNDGVIRNCSFSNLVMTDTTVGISLLIPSIIRDEIHYWAADVGREETRVENLMFSNIIMDRTASNPVLIDLSPIPEVKIAKIGNLHFSNIHASGPELPRIVGRSDLAVENISFVDCSFRQTDGSEFGNLKTHGACTHFDGEYHPMTIRHAKGILFQNTKVDVER